MSPTVRVTTRDRSDTEARGERMPWLAMALNLTSVIMSKSRVQVKLLSQDFSLRNVRLKTNTRLHIVFLTPICWLTKHESKSRRVDFQPDHMELHSFCITIQTESDISSKELRPSFHEMPQMPCYRGQSSS